MRNSRFIALCCAFLLPVIALTASADEGAIAERAFRQAEEPLRDRDWPAAVTALAAFRKEHANSPRVREALVLEADARLRAKDAQGALVLATEGMDAKADAWTDRIRHVAAAAYEALGKPGDAAKLLRLLADNATSKEVRTQIALRHKELADKDFVGVPAKDELGRDITKKNLSRAVTGYTHALNVGLPETETRAAHANLARIYASTGAAAKSIHHWTAVLKALGWDEKARTAPEPKDVSGNHELEAALAGRGMQRLKTGQHVGAREDLRAARTLAEDNESQALTSIVHALAQERLARTNDDVAFEEGIELLRSLLANAGPKASQATRRKLAEAYAQKGQALKAAGEWQAFVERHPNADFTPQARHNAGLMLARAGKYEEAISEWTRFLAAHSNHPLWKTVRDVIPNARFAIGDQREREGDVDGAIAAWRKFVQEYPAHPKAPQALQRIATAQHKRKEFDAVIATSKEVLGRYASSEQAPQMALGIALVLEEDLNRLDAAIEAYEAVVKNHGGNKAAREAQRRLDQLRAKHLEVVAERVVGSDVAPTIRVVTRNIEKLKVRVYRLGLEEYFRRKGTIKGVQDLQLEIVKPDWTAEWAIDPYEPLRLISAERPLPMKGAGAYVIVAGNDDLTSTTLMIVSDVECVVKRSKNTQLFVWAFDRKTQAPIEGARVIASDKSEVGVTGKDGVWQGHAGHSAERVLVVHDKHGLASTEISGGANRNRGFQSKAYVYTDRPVYRPGHDVKWRAIFLRASGGAYQTPRKQKGVATIYDARGNLVQSDEVTCSDFGTFDGSFALDALAPMGTWRVQLQVPRVGTWTGNFEVQAYRKPSLTIDVTPKKGVYATGETIQADLAVRYAFGGVVANVPVKYDVWRRPADFTPQVADDYGWYFKDERNDRKARVSTNDLTEVARGELTTDGEGNASFEVPTRELDADGEYIVRVHVRDVTGRWISDQDRVPVSRRDYMAVVKTERKVYKPKQEFPVEVRTVDARERPVARSGALKLLRLREVAAPAQQTKRSGRWRPQQIRIEEVPVTSYPLVVGETGTGELRLSMPGPGRFRLRWEGRDARGAPVTAYTDIEAAGEAEDLTKDARLVTARTLYREGEQAEVYLQSPITNRRALFTVEADGVLDYRFIDIKSSSTPLALTLEGKYAPNVHLAIAIPGDDELLEAKTEVVVLRHLDVSVSIEPKEPMPGDEVTVTVTTKDANGKPVAAEVGLSLVDETVYAVARDQAPRIRPYFYDQRRTHTVATSSSVGLQLVGTTRETNRDLLDSQAARSGGAKAMQVRSALRLAQESLSRGKYSEGVAHLGRALETDPTSVEARRMLNEVVADARRQGRTAELAKSIKGLALLGEDRKDKNKSDEDFEEAFGESEGLSDAPFEGPQNNATISIGGGAGGAFKGRGGGRDLGAGGGGRKRFNAPVMGRPAPKPGKVQFLAPQEQAAAARGFTDAFQAVHADPKVSAAAYFDDGAAFSAVQVRKNFRDTAHWAPAVQTKADGTATVKIKLPDNTTTWRAVVRGVSSQALVGAGRAGVTVRRPVVVRVDAPRFLTQGDEIYIPVVVHNQTEASVKGNLVVTAEGVQLTGEGEVLDVPAGGHKISIRKASAPAIGPVQFEAVFSGGQSTDAVKTGFPSLPRGLRMVDARSGVVDTTRGDVEQTFFEVPARTIAGSQKLVVALVPGIADALMDTLLQLDIFPYGCVEQTVHRFLPALEALHALRAAGHPAADQLAKLHESVVRAAARLRNLQNQDGSFGWFRGNQGDLAMTAYALRGLVGAREAGVPNLNQEITRASSALKGLMPKGTPDAQALAHLAWAEAGGFDAGLWAQTFRMRSDSLSNAGLAWLTVAAAKRKRGFDVDELTRLLIERRQEVDGFTFWKGRPRDCFTGSSQEATALAAWALVEAKIASPHPARAVAWLLSKRPSGPRARGTTKEQAAFVALAAAWLQQGREHGFGGTVEVLLNGAVVRTVTTGPGTLDLKDRRFVISEADALAQGRHTVSFRLKGQGSLNWTVRWTGVVFSADLPEAPHGITVARSYLDPETTPAPGQAPPVKPGYTVLREAARPRVEPKVKDVAQQGETVLVRLKLTTSRQLDYVLIEDPLPAGFEVVDDTTKGPFAWQERRDDKQVFFLRTLPASGAVVEYRIQAVHVGAFTALGTEAGAMYAPEFHGRAAGFRLSVRIGDTRDGGETTPTPDELYAEAVKLADAGDHKTARPIFESLKKEALRDDVLVLIERHLLVGAIETNDAKEIVRAREALVRRDPAKIPNDFESSHTIARAYETEGDAEVAINLYRGLVARGFGLERGYGKWLETFERAADGLDHIGTTLARFPVSNATAQAAFERAQAYAQVTRPEGRDKPAGVPMDEESIQALWDATAHFASTTHAPTFGYALVQATRQAGDMSGAAEVAEAFLRRFPKHTLADDVWLFLADVRFRTFEESPTGAAAKAVDAAAKPIISQKFPNGSNRMVDSPHRARAYHLMARVRHVMGDLAGAASHYHSARSIEDAREALAWLRAKRLDLKATHNIALDKPLAFPITYRNVGEATYKAYPVDLQVLFALRKTLDGLHKIDLSGIVPAREWTQKLPDASDFQEHEANVTIPNVEAGAGVWLVVIKAEKLERSTLLVRSDLEVKLQRVGNKVRVHVTGPDGRGVGGAFVTVSDGARIRARGLTDGRGTFEAPGVGSKAFVVVSKKDRYGVAR